MQHEKDSVDQLLCEWGPRARGWRRLNTQASFLEGACRGRVQSVRTCVRPAVSALRAAARPSEHASEGGPRTNNDWNSCWITNYEQPAPGVVPWAAVTTVSTHLYAPSSDTSRYFTLRKHAIQISGLYRTPVRPSHRVSGALWYQIAPNDEKRVVFRDRG